MRFPANACVAALKRAERLPAGALVRPPMDYAPGRRRDLRVDHIVDRVAFLGRGGAQPTRVELERLLGTNDLVDEFYLERALLSAYPVCRISIRSTTEHERGCATGVMVSPRLLLTNQHVFGSADEAAPSIAEFNYRFDVAGRPETSYRFRLRPDVYFFNDEALDFALVAVETQSMDDGTPLSAFGYHRLIPESGKALVKEWMTIIEHPGGARRQFAIRENECIDDQDPDVIWYMSDTAQGSSGSPVFNDSFQIVALHHAGVPNQDDQGLFILKDGRKVDDLSDVDDSEVDWKANAGIRVSRIHACVTQKAQEKNGCLAEFKAASQGGDILSNAYEGNGPGRSIVSNTRIQPGGGSSGARLVIGTLVLELNSEILARAVTGAVAPGRGLAVDPAVAIGDGDSSLVEGFKEPFVDTDYTSRAGFDPGFLGLSTPLPKVKDKTLIAPMLDGRTAIPYEHFTVVLHKERKLAIFTASNVDGSAAAKRPETGKDYTRDALTGLVSGQLEKWVIDPRIDAGFQIPDAFYNKDNGAFDKGHIVRREDVCFGKTYAQVRRANGDTFHVTNCSPQRGNFNRSQLHGIWGNLENFIGAQADTERFCLFAGPVLAKNDRVFVGTQRVQLPTRFWKVVCAVKGGKLQAFAFLLEQDVKDLPLEFQLTAEWKHKQLTLKALEKIVGLVQFPDLYHAADQA